MAINNSTAAVAGVSLSSGLVSFTNFSFSGLFEIAAVHASGEMPVIEFAYSGNVVEIRADGGAGGTIILRTSKYSSPNSWGELTGTNHTPGTWIGIGMSCSGVGANLWKIVYSTSSGVYTEFQRELGGTTFTPTAIRLLHGSVISSRGAYGACQNIKYGTGVLSASQLAAECWSLNNENSSIWTPLSTPMTSGATATAQKGTWTVVGSPGIIDGYFTGTTSGTLPTITVSTAVITGDAVAISGTLTSDSSSQLVFLDFLISGAVVYTLAGTPTSSTTWTATGDNIAPGSYTLRARVVDGNGTAASTYGTSLVFVGLSGEDQIPHVYPNTGILGVPALASIPAGSTSVFKAVNQSGAAIPGALVAVGNTSIATAAASLTDASGNVVVTGVAAGSTNLVLSVMNLGGSFLNAQVPLTITSTSVSTVTITPKTVSLFASQTQQFTSVISGGGTTLWTVESGGGSVDSNGLYTAPATAATVVVRATKSGFPTTFDEATVTVSAGQQQGIGARFIGDGDLAVAPGQSFSWQIRVEIDGEAAQGAVITPAALPAGLLGITQPLPTNANGTTTVTGQVVSDTPVNVSVAVTFDISVGTLSMQLTATVTVIDSPYGYVILRGGSYPRPYEQK